MHGRTHTDVFLPVALDDLGQLHVARYDGHLVRSLVGVVQRLPVRSSEQELPGARFLVVHRTHVQGRVAGRVPGVHVGPVEEQVVEVLEQPGPARLQHRIQNLPLQHNTNNLNGDTTTCFTDLPQITAANLRNVAKKQVEQ